MGVWIGQEHWGRASCGCGADFDGRDCTDPHGHHDLPEPEVVMEWGTIAECAKQMHDESDFWHQVAHRWAVKPRGELQVDLEEAVRNLMRLAKAARLSYLDAMSEVREDTL